MDFFSCFKVKQSISVFNPGYNVHTKQTLSPHQQTPTAGDGSAQFQGHETGLKIAENYFPPAQHHF